MRTLIILIATTAQFLTPQLTFGQVNYSYNNKNYVVSPIDLQYFRAENNDNQIFITWGLGSELTNVLELQKSVDGRDFETIATLQDYATPQKNAYSFSDKMSFKNADKVVSDLIYYRLKKIDANHIFEYSKVIAVEEINEMGLAYATPKSYQIAIKKSPDAQAFSIVNATGQVILNGQVRDTEAVDIRRLPAGFYCLNIQSMKVRFLKN